jgi:hypothetical protein
MDTGNVPLKPFEGYSHKANQAVLIGIEDSAKLYVRPLHVPSSLTNSCLGPTESTGAL